MNALIFSNGEGIYKRVLHQKEEKLIWRANQWDNPYKDQELLVKIQGKRKENILRVLQETIGLSCFRIRIVRI